MNRFVKKNEYILTISIPTFGYPDEVKKTVTHLLSLKRHDVQIVVVDNDYTGQQIGCFMESITDPRFRYYRNKKNIGRSSNIVKAIEVASSDHVLIISSEDSVRFDAIDVVIGEITENPECGIIMGKVLTSLGNIIGYKGKKRTYAAGYEALLVTPRMGNLIPIIVNKRYLDFDKLYHQEEMYMQTRIALTIAGKGDFIGIEEVIADVVDDLEWRKNDKELPCYKTVDWEKEGEKLWSIRECYYSPEARANQLKHDLESIEEASLRMSHLIHLVDRWTTDALFSALLYPVECLDYEMLKNSKSVGFLGYKKSLHIFEQIMEDYFEDRAKKNLYHYTGYLRDKIQNELVTVKKAEDLLNEIIAEERVFITGGEKDVQLLRGFLEFIGISVIDEIKDNIVLVPTNYDAKMQKLFVKHGAKKIYFMDWMSRYFTILWCNQHQSKDYIGKYLDFVFN